MQTELKDSTGTLSFWPIKVRTCSTYPQRFYDRTDGGRNRIELPNLDVHENGH